MRIVFMGTPDYGAASLGALLDAGFDVVAVFTQPDRPKGRGGKISISPVKALAKAKGIAVFQPHRIRSEGLEDLRALRPDLCVTAAFGQILSQEILDVPRLGTVNVHASLLPKYRGSSPVSWALMQGESITGVTTMMTDRGIDTGDILLKQEVPIGPTENAQQLLERLAQAGAALLIKTINGLVDGSVKPVPQDEAQASYFPRLTRDLGIMDWQKPAIHLFNQVRGLYPWPGASTASPWGQLKVLSASVAEDSLSAKPGEILPRQAGQGILVKTGEGTLSLDLIQAAGGKAMPAGDFLRGRTIPALGQMGEGEQTA